MAGDDEPRDATTLRGERVVLRPLRPDDAGPLEAILREPEVARWWSGSEGDPGGVVRELYDDAEAVSFAIEVDGEPVGVIQYAEEESPDYRHAGIDVFLATAWHGRGLGTEAVRVLVRHLVEDRGHHRLTIDPAAANERAIRAYQRVGFRAVGVMREYERGPDGVWRDGLLMDLLAHEIRDA